MARLGVQVAGDLLTLWPRRYQDRTEVRDIALCRAGESAVVLAQVVDVKARPLPGRDLMATVTVTDGSGFLDVAFFHARYLIRQFIPGQTVMLQGRVQRRGARLTMSHPEWELVTSDGPAGIVPVYPLAGDLKQRWVRQLMGEVLPGLAVQERDALPGWVQERLGLPPRIWALQTIHAPPTQEDRERARARLVMDEVLVIALGVQWLRQRERGDLPGQPLWPDGPLAQKLLQRLPFRLTAGQQKAWHEIAHDLAEPRPMARLLQGDVGSGKTVVAALACLAAVDAGAQAAFMAPTELLADQQALVLEEWYGPLGVRVARLTADDGPDTRSRLTSHEVDVVVGTQALIQDAVSFRHLALVVVDEQHRFGVRQRSRLGAKGQYPHSLVMTATPIPRTLALTVYGDLDVSMIEGLPPGRKPIVTRRVAKSERRLVYQEVMAAVRRGEQAYVVCPFVEESDAVTAKNATALYEGMQKVPGWRVALLHGRMPRAVKEQTMERFRRRAIDVLVSTTIIEVGVDVPNATMMVIEDADRFGLAQLHQLRGRVGRGAVAAQCILIADPGGDEAEARLNALVTTENGFELAEADLAIRGPGEVLGLRQHGLAGFQLADPLKDLAALVTARELAREILAQDPELNRAEHWDLKQAVLQALGQLLPGSVLH